MKILHLDSNHPLLIEQLTDLGHQQSRRLYEFKRSD